MKITWLPEPNLACLAGIMRPIVCIYVLRDCTICAAAYEVAESIRREFPEVQVKLVDLADPGEAIPASVCAAPTYLEIISKSLCHPCTARKRSGATTDFEIDSY